MSAGLLTIRSGAHISGQRIRRADGFLERWHRHECGQLIWSPIAVQLVQTAACVWVTPHRGAVWVPPGEYHRPMSLGAGWEHDLYFDSELCGALPKQSCVVAADASLRVVLDHTFDALESGGDPDTHLPMLLSSVRNAGLMPLKNPLPPGCLGTLSMELVRPGDASLPDSRAAWAELAGMTPSALSRALRRETSLSFRDWRQVVRLVRALSLLATGASTSGIAAQVGYRSASHLVATFRQALGVTPQRYFRPLAVASRSARAERSGEALAEANPAPVARATSNVRAFVSDEPAVPDGNYVSPHEHEAGELLWSPTGVLTVGTPSGTWVVDAMHGVWLPPGIRHDLLEWGGTRLHYFFIDAAACARLPAECCAIAASEPLRAALLQLCAGDHANPEGAAQALFAAIRRAPLAPLPLPVVQTQRLRPMVALMRQHPAHVLSARRWAQYFEMSPRAFSRQCNKELGAPFGRWRRLMLVRYSVERLRAGDDVTTVASNAGYTNVSMFIAMFRQALGTTPGRYLALSTSANGARLSGP